MFISVLTHCAEQAYSSFARTTSSSKGLQKPKRSAIKAQGSGLGLGKIILLEHQLSKRNFALHLERLSFLLIG